MRFVTLEVENFCAENEALGSDPVGIMRARAAALVEEYRGKFDSELPLDMELLAALRSIKVIREPLEEGVSGELIPVPDGLLARINASHTPGRQNFSIGHEISHTFFPGYKEIAYRKEKNVYWTTENAGKAKEANGEVEFLCDVGASDLLMPRAEFLKEMDRRRLSVTAILELAELFGASCEATTIRLVEETAAPMAVVFCHKAIKPAERKRMEQQQTTPGTICDPKPVMRVRKIYRSSCFEGYIPPHCSVPEDSPFTRAQAGADPVEGCGLITFGSNNYFAQTLRFGVVALKPLDDRPEDQYVMGLLLQE